MSSDKKINPSWFMLGFGVLLFSVILFIDYKKEVDLFTAKYWFLRVLTALAAASISMSISGIIKIDGDTSIAQKVPKISASGAIAIFIIVYLFNPIVQ